MVPGDRSGPGSSRSGDLKQRLQAIQPRLIRIRHRAVDGIANDGRQRDVPTASLSTKASHLVLGQRNLRPDHELMITLQQEDDVIETNSADADG